jgi:hypothetical protein
LFVEQSHVHGVRLRPQAEQGEISAAKIARDTPPSRFVDHGTRGRPLRFDFARLGDQVDQAHQFFSPCYPKILATFWNQTTSGGGR